MADDAVAVLPVLDSTTTFPSGWTVWATTVDVPGLFAVAVPPMPNDGSRRPGGDISTRRSTASTSTVGAARRAARATGRRRKRTLLCFRMVGLILPPQAGIFL